MRVAYERRDPTEITIDEAEALRDAGLELEMVYDNGKPKEVVAWMNIGNIFDREEEKRNERDIG